MARTLELKLKEFNRTLKILDEVLAEEESDIVRDSVVKRFEYTFEIAWKAAKEFLREEFGVEVFSPKEVFRNLRKNDLFSDEDTEYLIEMVDDRNEIIHTYNLDFANELEDKIRDRYFGLLGDMYKVVARGIKL